MSEHLVNGQGCFSLWYHMYGEDIGSLAIYTTTKTNQMTEIYRISGAQGNEWKILNVDVGVTLQDKEWMRIVIEGVVGQSYEGIQNKIFNVFDLNKFYLGDIAIDDLSWSPNITCPTGELTTTTNAPSPMTTYRMSNFFFKL